MGEKKTTYSYNDLGQIDEIKQNDKLVANVSETEDYTGPFVTLGAQVSMLIESISTWASDEQRVTYIPEYGASPGVSTGASGSWYFGLDSEWIYYDELPEGYMYRDDVIDSSNKKTFYLDK